MGKRTTHRAKHRKEKRITNKIQYYDYSLLAILICLICFGLVMLFSTSSYRALIDYGDSMHFFKRQLAFTLLGLVGMYIVSKIPYRWYYKRAKAIYFLSIFLMALVQTPLGKTVNGARRWLRLPMGLTLQPAEIAKIAVILFIPMLICQMGKQIKPLAGVIKVLVWGGISSACVFFLTDNLSTAIIVAGIVCILIFVAHPKTAPFVGIAAAGMTAIVVGVSIISATMTTSNNFRLQRIISWLNPEAYSSDESFQTLQSLYAIGSGGFFGKGLGNSVQKEMIPEVQNDMILSVICEELGVCGAIIIMVLFAMMIYRLAFIAQNAPDLYGSLIVTGIMAHISLQVILNIAVVTNTIPNTGITLPFFSYGGTSVLFLLAEMGIALGVSSKIQIEE